MRVVGEDEYVVGAMRLSFSCVEDTVGSRDLPRSTITASVNGSKVFEAVITSICQDTLKDYTWEQKSLEEAAATLSQAHGVAVSPGCLARLLVMMCPEELPCRDSMENVVEGCCEKGGKAVKKGKGGR